MNSKIITTAAFILLITGCNKMPATSGGNSAGGSNETSDVADPTSGKPDRATAQAALDFVISRLNKTDVSRAIDKGGNVSTNWTPSDIKLSSGNWSWTERNVEMTGNSSGAAITDTTERYKLTPGDLSYPTTAKEIEINGRKMWAVVLECATKDCISVAGERAEMSQLVFDNEPTNNKTPISERRESNLWYFYEQDVAKRVAHALDVVLNFEGARSRQF